MPKTIAARQLTVGIGLVVDADRVLFVKRQLPNVPEYDEKWELPGGKLELGEGVERAIEREVWEETAVSVVCLELLPFSYVRAVDTGSERLNVVVLCASCELTSATTHARAASPSAPLSAVWFSIGNIPFDKVIPGSREFLLWRLHTLYPDRVPPQANLYEMNLQAVDYDENRFRHYRVVISFHPEKTARYEVRREWGRIGRQPSVKAETFRLMEDALSHAQELVADRQAHGYRLTFVQDNHPLRSWLRDRNIPRDEALLSDSPHQRSLFDDN